MREDPTYPRPWRWQWHAGTRPAPQGPCLNRSPPQLSARSHLRSEIPRFAVGSAPGVLPTERFPKPPPLLLDPQALRAGTVINTSYLPPASQGPCTGSSLSSVRPHPVTRMSGSWAPAARPLGAGQCPRSLSWELEVPWRALPGNVGGLSRWLPPPSLLPPSRRAHLFLLHLFSPPPVGQSVLSLRGVLARLDPPPRSSRLGPDSPTWFQGLLSAAPCVCVGGHRRGQAAAFCPADGCLLVQPLLRGHERQTLLPSSRVPAPVPSPRRPGCCCCFALCTPDTPDVLIPSTRLWPHPQIYSHRAGRPPARFHIPVFSRVCVLPQAPHRHVTKIKVETHRPASPAAARATTFFWLPSWLSLTHLSPAPTRRPGVGRLCCVTSTPGLGVFTQ